MLITVSITGPAQGAKVCIEWDADAERCAKEYADLTLSSPTESEATLGIVNLAVEQLFHYIRVTKGYEPYSRQTNSRRR